MITIVTSIFYMKRRKEFSSHNKFLIFLKFRYEKLFNDFFKALHTDKWFINWKHFNSHISSQKIVSKFMYISHKKIRNQFNLFQKRLHLRCFAGFEIRLWVIPVSPVHINATPYTLAKPACNLLPILLMVI